MSICLYHTQCPECAKRGRDNHHDNLAVYDDGHSWCFACGYHDFANTVNPDSLSKKPSEREKIILPRNTVPVFETDNKDAWNWLNQFNLTIPELEKHHVMFSEEGLYGVKPMVIFPCYGNIGELIGYTGRNLGSLGTKWLTKGPIHSEFIYPVYCPEKTNQEACVIVEDVISAIKVGRVIDTYPCFTLRPSPTLVNWLSKHYLNLLIWLDFDAVSQALVLQQELQSFFDRVKVVISEKDPKLYQTEQVKGIIQNVLG